MAFALIERRALEQDPEKWKPVFRKWANTVRDLVVREQAALPHSIDEAAAGRPFERCSERSIFLAAGAGQRGDPVQVILRLVAVALLDLPQSVILPGLDVVRVGLQRALVPALRDLVVAELAIGVAHQVGDGGVVVVTERLQLLDGGGIVVAVIDRGVGGAIALRECRILDAGAGFAGLLLGGLAVIRRGR